MATLTDKISKFSVFFGGHFESVLTGEKHRVNSKEKKEFRNEISHLFNLIHSEASRKPINTIIRSIVEEFESYDAGIELSLKKDFEKHREGMVIVYEYKGKERIGLRKIETRVKSPYSLFKKLIIARLFDKKINDIFGAIIVRDDPNAIKVDFERLSELKSRKFPEVAETYQNTFEKQDISAIKKTGNFLQSENSQKDLRWRVISTAPRYFKYQNFPVYITIQNYKHLDRSRNLQNFIKYWPQEQGAQKFMEDKKEKLRSNKKISKYQELQGTHGDECFFYESDGKLEILARKNNVALNFQGEKNIDIFKKDSEEFINRIFSRFGLREQEAELLAQGIISSDKKWPSEEGLSSINFKLSPFEMPDGWLEDVIEPDSELETILRKEKGLYRDRNKDPPLLCRDWVTHPKKNNFRSLNFRVEGSIEIQLQTSLMYYIQKKGEAAHGDYKSRIDTEIDNLLKNSLVAKDSGFLQENIKAFNNLFRYVKEAFKQEYIKKAHYYAEQIPASKTPVYFLDRLLDLYESFKLDFGETPRKEEIKETLKKMIPEKGLNIIRNIRLTQVARNYLKQKGVEIDTQEIEEQAHFNYLKELEKRCRNNSRKKDHISQAISIGLASLILNYEEIYGIKLPKREKGYDFGSKIDYDKNLNLYHSLKFKKTDKLMMAVEERLEQGGFDEHTTRLILSNI